MHEAIVEREITGAVQQGFLIKFTLKRMEQNEMKHMFRPENVGLRNKEEMNLSRKRWKQQSKKDSFSSTSCLIVKFILSLYEQR